MALYSPSAVVKGRCVTITKFYNELVGALIALSSLGAAFACSPVFSSSVPADAVSREGAEEDAAALVAHQNGETKSVPLL